MQVKLTTFFTYPIVGINGITFLLLRYEIENEKKARSVYEKCMYKIYSNVSFDDAGFHIHLDFNYLGATPDGFVSCSCCGSGIFEIKCPFSKMDSSIDEAIQDRKFYLQNKNGEITLMKNHAYYYQVQAQLFVTNKQYCDFNCYTGREVHIERINKDDTIRNCLDQIYSFYLLGVLPELVAKWHTVQRPRNNQVKVVIEFD